MPVQYAAQDEICQPRASTAAQSSRNAFHILGRQESESGLDGVQELMHRRCLDEEPDLGCGMFPIEIDRTPRSLLFFPKQAFDACRGDGRLNVECDGLAAKHTADAQTPQP